MASLNAKAIDATQPAGPAVGLLVMLWHAVTAVVAADPPSPHDQPRTVAPIDPFYPCPMIS